jgi:hypothetical protein
MRQVYGMMVTLLLWEVCSSAPDGQVCYRRRRAAEWPPLSQFSFLFHFSCRISLFTT